MICVFFHSFSPKFMIDEQSDLPFRQEQKRLFENVSYSQSHDFKESLATGGFVSFFLFVVFRLLGKWCFYIVLIAFVLDHLTCYA